MAERQNSKRLGRVDRKQGQMTKEQTPQEQEEIQKFTWDAKTQLGADVLAGKYSTLAEVVQSGRRIMEPEIIDYLEPNFAVDFINVGQAKGKFGGGKRRIAKPTQKKTREGNKMSFQMITVTGDRNGIVGLGFGKARETVPAREKAVRSGKMNLIQIRRGSGSWGSFGAGSTSIPFAVEGKCGSSRVRFIPAPVGTGLVVEQELRKMLELAGIKDIWSQTFGQTKNKGNLMKAGFEALKQLQKMKLTPQVIEGRGLKDGGKDEQ